eukprot:3935877-Rhodomonas_salina.1
MRVQHGQGTIPRRGKKASKLSTGSGIPCLAPERKQGTALERMPLPCRHFSEDCQCKSQPCQNLPLKSRGNLSQVQKGPLTRSFSQHVSALVLRECRDRPTGLYPSRNPTADLLLDAEIPQ